LIQPDFFIRQGRTSFSLTGGGDIMAKRKIIRIDDKKCNGCGACIPNCPEGALQIIDGKARLVSDLFCDGLGACLGTCPQGAITVEEREAESYNERKVMENVFKQGENTILAHLKHLKEHGEMGYLKEAIDFLKERNFEVPEEFMVTKYMKKPHEGCPGMKTMDFGKIAEEEEPAASRQPSALRQWPIQLHLVSPNASYFQGKDVLLAADCTAYALGDFHPSYLKGKTLAIACPKLDSGMDIYVEKIKALVDEAKINTLTVMIMQVPCCRGLLALASQALKGAIRKIPLKLVIVGIQGEILKEEG
jgi:ferredoxin